MGIYLSCRNTTIYSFGDNISNLDDYAWYNGDFLTGGTRLLGQKKNNHLGLYNMYGNVWEWVQYFYSENYYSESPAIDPQGPKSGDKHVVRGGSWHTSPTSWKSTFCKSYDLNYRGISIGFRIVMIEER